MHELSIAMEVIDIIQREAASHGASVVKSVRLRIGELSGVETESLAFCFDAVKAQSSLTAAAELIIENIPVSVHCLSCGGVFRTAGCVTTCPSCGGFNTRQVEGEELDIKDFEIE